MVVVVCGVCVCGVCGVCGVRALGEGGWWCGGGGVFHVF